jgi:hypothetical protein
MFSALQALARAEAVPTYGHALCMQFVSEMYDNPYTYGAYPSANDNWNKSIRRHPGDRNPPAGAPVNFTGPDGHICFATGKGEELWSTDWAGYGINGYTTISQIEASWGRTYYGWTGDVCGFPIDFSGLASLSITPFGQEQDMTIYERGVNSGTFGLGYGGGWKDIDNSTIANVRDVLTQAFGAPVQQMPADYDTIRALLLSTVPAPAPATPPLLAAPAPLPAPAPPVAATPPNLPTFQQIFADIVNAIPTATAEQQKIAANNLFLLISNLN